MRLVVRRSPGPPRLSDSQGITGNWVAGSAEVVLASPAPCLAVNPRWASTDCLPAAR